MEIWGAAVKRPDGCRMAAVGFCAAGNASRCAKRVKRLEALSFETEDIVQIDFLLASKLQELFSEGPEGVSAVGASVYVPSLDRRVPPTGGVLGSPRDEGGSSRSELEELGPGLWLYTRPGGPGWVVAGPRSTAESILRAMKELDLPRRELVAWLTAEFERRGPDGFLIISDGTGTGSYGFAAAGNRGGTMAYHLSGGD